MNTDEEAQLKLDRELVEAALDKAAKLLPTQGPLSVFNHQNTLHAFEDIPFEKAVVEAGQLFGCEPFLSERRYREELEDGRIRWQDILDELDLDLGLRGQDFVIPDISLRELYARLLRYPIDTFEDDEIEWALSESNFLERFRSDLASDTTRKLRSSILGDSNEAEAVRALWEACLDAVSLEPAASDQPSTLLRPRDFLLNQTGIDTDEDVNPLLIRYTSAYLDQGISYWPMRDRDLGFYRCFLDLYAGARGIGSPWFARLGEIAKQELRSDANPVESILRSLHALDIKACDLDGFVSQSLLALRGWAGMIREAERRPDRLPGRAVPAKLEEFFAIRLIADRATAEQLSEEHNIPLWALPTSLKTTAYAELAVKSRACWFHQVAQILGLGATELEGLPFDIKHNLITQAEAFSETDRRRILHLAYERRHRINLLSALESHVDHPAPSPEKPSYQAIFCIDEREESFRRHLEEVDSSCETLGYPGFFGAAFYYKGADASQATPLCPVNIFPDHEVPEVPDDYHADQALRRRALRKALGKIAQQSSIGSQTFARGALLTLIFGGLAVVPLLLRVIAPRTTAILRRLGVDTFVPQARTRLAIDRDSKIKSSSGSYQGYTKQEMADIVQNCLVQIGRIGKLADLIIAVGHGSSSLNNPHESAHGCGACGGGRGGPNARAFALMANDPSVRAILEERSIVIPSSTHVVGAYHNTCSDTMKWYDLDRIPDSLITPFNHIQNAFDEARSRHAHERSRRFESADPENSPRQALRHVTRRSEDLAQVRPEYGHATCAVCLVGRRERTRGLFLDRRAFLNSYDPTTDPNGSTLARLLATAGPVCAKINLEYYFSHVDPTGYGCGTKLPHNVTSLIGVMDGHASDLRTGLPWQMVEIHEPVRLLMVVETPPEIMSNIISQNEELARLVHNRWIQLALLSPETNDLTVFDKGSFLPFVQTTPSLPSSTSSLDWYRRKTGHLLAARIEVECSNLQATH